MEVIKNNNGGVKICLVTYMYTQKSTKVSKVKCEYSQRMLIILKQYMLILCTI